MEGLTEKSPIVDLQNVLEKKQATHWKAKEYIQLADRDWTNECPKKCPRNISFACNAFQSWCKDYPPRPKRSANQRLYPSRWAWQGWTQGGYKRIIESFIRKLTRITILLNNMPKNGLRTKIMGFANKMSESIIAERLYWCSRNAILFANCSQSKEKGATFLM